jgi:AcrR family transcriptional regulator
MACCEKWIETGYLLFAQDGAHGLQIERIARILKLNKSGFYHYFGTLEVFHDRLMSHHIKCVELFAADIKQNQYFVPDFLHSLLRHKITATVHVQLKRNNNNLNHSVVIKSDQLIDLAILPIWIKHIGMLRNDSLAYHYWGWVRDGFYTRINLENYCYPHLLEYASDVKEVVAQMLALGSAKKLELLTINGAV